MCRPSSKEIITEKSLNAVRTVIEFLKEDIIQRDIFRATGHDAVSQQIARELSRGGPNLDRILEENSVRDIASGLMFFLVYLKKPLIPHDIQAIVLDPDNRSVPPEVVAQDVLGLMEDQITGRQFILLQSILDFLNHILKYTPTDELSGTTVPIYMMPVFFKLQAHHMPNWRRVAVIFLEIIRLAPAALNIVSDTGNEVAINNLIAHNLSVSIPSNLRIFARTRRAANSFSGVNAMIRRYLNNNYNRGDGQCLETATRRFGIFQERPSLRQLALTP